MKNFYRKIIFFPIIIFLIFSYTAEAQTVNYDASKLLAHVGISFSPKTGSFAEGSTFEVPILLNTKGKSINGIEVRINFDKDRLSIVNQTGGTSIIGVWVEPPSYDNTRGTASYVGVVPNGIITDAGLIGTITFKAKSTGRALVSVSLASKILLNDGLGTETILDLARAEYSILAKAPEGVIIYSETHPVQSDWYNNNSPSFSWTKDPGVTGFSLEIDNKPGTVPDNIIDTEETTKSFESLADGLWYLHVKAIKNGIWGTTGQFLVRIDTAPPAEFKPEANYLVSAVILTERTLVSFFTTDNLSGIDHYEVGVIDKNQPATASPAFIEAESPFQVPLVEGGMLEVIVRAVDKAGNVRDASVDVRPPKVVGQFIKENIIYILMGIILLGFCMLILHYLFGHHIISRLRKAMRQIDREDNDISRGQPLREVPTYAPPKPQPLSNPTAEDDGVM